MAADALATDAVAARPMTAAPTQIILFRCKVRFLSEVSRFKFADWNVASTACPAVHACREACASRNPHLLLSCYQDLESL